MTGSIVTPARMPRGARAARSGNERGAILIHVAVALLGLLAFSAFSIDHGVMMVSRGQAQNAADAGAWAAALYLANDNPGDQAGAQAIAVAAAQVNGVWGAQPDINLADVTFPPCPPGAPGLPDTCVKVDVFRNQRAGGNPLPVFFSSLIGVADQGVRATATAQIVSSNSATCVLPFAIPDYWQEARDDEAGTPAVDDTFTVAVFPDDNDPEDGLGNWEWDVDDTYDHHDSGDTPYAAGPLDTYDVAIGFTLNEHHGMRLLLKAGNPGDAINPGHYFPITLVPGQTGASVYRSNISGCNEEASFSMPYALPNEPGNMIGPTRQGVENLIAQDPGATWDTTYQNPVTGNWGQIIGSACSPSCGTASGFSPRLRPVPLFDPHAYDAGRESGRLDIFLTRFGGFFIEQMIGNDVLGHLSIAPAVAGGGPLDDESAFLRTVILVR